MAKSCLIVSLLLLLLAHQAIAADADFYTAGVVEFEPGPTWQGNLAAYLEIVHSANASGTDIIVFPEATLNGLGTATFVPAPEEQALPCLDDGQASHYHELLVSLSCAARNASKYIVINVSEQQLCPDGADDPRPCAASGLNIYNTNVVFDRQGRVVSRYRKVHLYDEPRNTTYEPERIYFETDFGVRFGHFVCFDILFYTPAHELIVEAGVRDFVYPTMWFSQLPFLTAVQTQHAWAYGSNVNLLAAGASYPAYGSTGTGIYHGRAGTLTSVMNVLAGERRIYVARVPKWPDAETGPQERRRRRSLRQPRLNSADIQLKRDSVELYESELLPLDAAASNWTRELCHGSLCCRFELAWRLLGEPPANGSHYRLGVYEGTRSEDAQGSDANYVRNCALFSCRGPTIEECGQLPEQAPPAQVVFTRLLIEARLPHSQAFLLLPNSLLDNLLPLEPSQFEWSQVPEGHYHNARYGLNGSLELANLLTFAIYGNYYDDVCTYAGRPDEACGYKDGAATLHLSLWLAMLPMAALTLRWS